MKLDHPDAFTTFSDEDGVARIGAGTVDVPVIVTATGDPVSGGANLHPQAGDNVTFRIRKTAYAAPAFQDVITYKGEYFSVKQFFPEQDFWVLLTVGTTIPSNR